MEEKSDGGNVVKSITDLPVRGRISLTETSLEIAGELTYEEWEELGGTLQQIARSWQWWVGDWLLYGEHKWGEKYAQAVEDTGRSEESLKQAQWVSSRIPKFTRVNNLSWSHHRAVAGLDTLDEREAVLEQAVGNGWSFRETREAVKKYRHNLKLEERKKERREKQGLGGVTITQGDALELLEGLKPESFDLLLTDPPYITEFDDEEEFIAFAVQWTSRALRAIKPTGRAYIFTGAYPTELSEYIRTFNVKIRTDFRGWTLDNPLAWTYKNQIGPAPSHRYRLNWQACFHLYGPDAADLNTDSLLERFAVQEVNAPDGRFGIRDHPWQKPDDLAERLIRHATVEGDSVLDPFCGTGTFVAAAERMGRSALGIERDPEMLTICAERGLEVPDAA